MRNDVVDWVQEGRLCVWRYVEAGRHWRGWQWSADPIGARSLRNLLDRMRGGDFCHRTLRLEHVTDTVLSVPNAGFRVAERCSKLRVEYRPDCAELMLEPDGGVLTLTVGGTRLVKLAAALAEVEVGLGDFGIRPTDDRKAEAWMFWWMPDVSYHQGKRL
jgi:hypothetical protein